jgi:hypothetical protein
MQFDIRPLPPDVFGGHAAPCRIMKHMDGILSPGDTQRDDYHAERIIGGRDYAPS